MRTIADKVFSFKTSFFVLCVCMFWRRCISWPTGRQVVSCGVCRLWKYRSFYGILRTSTRWI